MDSKEQLEWIEQYLEGKLAGDELKAFDQKMAADPSFAAEVKLQKEIAEAMTENDVLELSQKIRAIQHQKKQRPAGPGRTIFIRRFLQIAAGLALLLAVYFVYENFNQTYTPQELAAQYFSPEEQISHSTLQTERFSDPDSTAQVKNELSKKIDDLWSEIEELYTQNKFDLALEKLNNIQQLDPSFQNQSANEYYYYHGFLSLLNENPEKAIQSFEKVEMTYTEKATWYSALSYLKLGDVENAKNQLSFILATELHPFKESARKLMEEIENLN